MSFGGVRAVDLVDVRVGPGQRVAIMGSNGAGKTTLINALSGFVPLSQGTMLYRMLQEMGVDVTMVTYPRSPHVPREPRERMDVMRRNLEFFLPLQK